MADIKAESYGQPQWPFIPAIEGQVPLPKPDPRSAMVKALMSNAPIPMPKPDPRSWTDRVIAPLMKDEANSAGAIDPDALMQSRGIQPPIGHSIDKFQYEGYPVGMSPTQYPLGMQPPIKHQQRDVGLQPGQGVGSLFSVPNQHLQQMAATQPKPDQNLPKLPQSGFIPSLSPMYMNDTHPLSRPPVPNVPPVYWQPG